MKLSNKCLQRASCNLINRYANNLIVHIQYKHITFNADDENKESKLDENKKAKPLENNFVFRVFQELGNKSQDREQRKALKHNPLENEEDAFNDTKDYFRKHDRPSHRLFGMYYKMAHSEIASFHHFGFGSINHLLHPMIDEELPLFYEVIDGIFTGTINDFDFKKDMENSEVILNLDIGHLRDENVGGDETKIDETISIIKPPVYQPKIYHQQYSIIRNIRNCIKTLKGNFFEHRGLSIAKQLFVNLYRTNVIKDDLQLLSNDILLIDAKNFLESVEEETIRFPGPQLVSICDIPSNDDLEQKDKQYLFCVLAIQNSIVTLKRRQFDPNNIPPNIPLAGGSVLLVDPNMYSSVLYWRRTNDPATFFINSYGEKSS